MRNETIYCDRCRKVISNQVEVLEISLDHNHPLVKQNMRHGTTIYLSMLIKVFIASKVDEGWQIQQDLCESCLRETIGELIR